MSMNFESFKTTLGSLQNTSIKYIDEEGSEIPIDCDLEFQEAVRLSKLNKNRLTLVFYKDGRKYDQKVFTNLGAPSSNTSKKLFDVSKIKKMKSVPFNFNVSQSCCSCNGDTPPEWFTSYMKKFKKDLLQELKSSIQDSLDKGVEKEKKMTRCKLEPVNIMSEPMVSVTSVHNQKKKKLTDKEPLEWLEQREVKIMKKLEKLHPTKSERLEKLDNKTKLLLEEKRKLIERKRHMKSKILKNSLSTSDKKNILKKSASFKGSEMFLFLNPGSEFTLSLKVKNDGKVRWSAPQVQCFDCVGLYPNEVKISLPRLHPTESFIATIRGTAAKTTGLHYFKCRIVDGLERISSEFICRGNVDSFEPLKTYCNVLSNADGSNSVGSLIDFEKELITSSQKKIEENIIEIEKRLQDIDLLRPAVENSENLRKAKKVNHVKECSSVEYDSGVQERLVRVGSEKEKVLVGLDCLRLFSKPLDAKTQNKTKDNFRSLENTELVKDNSKVCSKSDSESSVVFLSDDENAAPENTSEDENFIFVPMPSKSPSPAESVHEDSKFLNSDVNEMLTFIKEAEVLNPKEQTIILETTSNTSELYRDSSENRRPLLEESDDFKPKKMKSKSTTYHYSFKELTAPTLKALEIEGRPSKFNFMGDKEEKYGEGSSDQRPSQFTFIGEKRNSEEDLKDFVVPNIESVVYVVRSDGCCWPVSGEYRKSSEKRKSVKANDDFLREEISAFIRGVGKPLIKEFSNAAETVIKQLKSSVSQR